MVTPPLERNIPRALGPRSRTQRRAVTLWLWSVAALVFLMVVVGGATRLTESGLSITEWKPLTGIIPPLSEEAWRAEFETYKRIPQYSEVFPDMDLGGFKVIFFWEWSHRFLGRLIGLAFALPLLLFWWKGALRGGLAARLCGVLALGALQGFVGWWMVKSGLIERTEVAQERLAIHLLLASLTFALLVWLAASLNARKAEIDARVLPGLRRFAWAMIALVLFQIGLGALVAGLRAGRAYNTWPLIDGSFVPPLEKLALLEPLWRNVLDNMLLIQFEHRMVAYLLVGLAAAQAFFAVRVAPKSPASRRALIIMGLVALQAAIGIVTLVLIVPLWAGLLHQALAMIVLGAAVVHAQALSKDL
jgi:cytochrome c oxidase assembly protein subunit 15